jgi:hypothetical protein
MTNKLETTDANNGLKSPDSQTKGKDRPRDLDAPHTLGLRTLESWLGHGPMNDEVQPRPHKGPTHVVRQAGYLLQTDDCGYPRRSCH